MLGSLRKRGNSWQLRVFLGADLMAGKKVYSTLSIRGTKREAERELTRMVREIDSTGFVAPEKVTLGTYVRRWLDEALAASSRSGWTQQA